MALTVREFNRQFPHLAFGSRMPGLLEARIANSSPRSSPLSFPAIVSERLEELASQCGETRSPNQILRDLVTDAWEESCRRRADFLGGSRQDHGRREPAGTTAHVHLGTIRLKPNWFRREVDCHLRLQFEAFGLHTLLQAGPGLDKAAADYSVGIARQLLMRGFRVAVFDDSTMPGLAAAVFGAVRTAFPESRNYVGEQQVSALAEHFARATDLHGQERIACVSGIDGTAALRNAVAGHLGGGIRTQRTLVITVGKRSLETQGVIPSQLRAIRFPVLSLVTAEPGSLLETPNHLNRIEIRPEEVGAGRPLFLYSKISWSPDKAIRFAP